MLSTPGFWNLWLLVPCPGLPGTAWPHLVRPFILTAEPSLYSAPNIRTSGWWDLGLFLQFFSVLADQIPCSLFWVKEWTLDIPKCYDIKHSMVIKGDSVEARRTRLWKSVPPPVSCKPTSDAGVKVENDNACTWLQRCLTPGQALLLGGSRIQPRGWAWGVITAQMITVSEKCDLGTEKTEWESRWLICEGRTEDSFRKTENSEQIGISGKDKTVLKILECLYH